LLIKNRQLGLLRFSINNQEINNQSEILAAANVKKAISGLRSPFCNKGMV